MEDEEYTKLLNDCSGLYMVKLLHKDKWYCFEKDELREIYDSLTIPGTDEAVEDAIICMGNEFNKDDCYKPNSYKVKTSIYRDEEGYLHCEDGCFYDKNEKCVISGLIMCLGIAVVNKNGDKILCHYVTGDDDSETEKNKLKKVKEEMQERNWNWDNSTLKIYYMKNIKYKDAQNKSINIAAEALNIDREKITLRLSESGKIYFEPNTKIM